MNKTGSQIQLFGSEYASSRPLDTIVNRSFGSWQQMERRAMKFVSEAIQIYKPKAIFSGFSGGTDSLMATEILMRYLPQAKVAHINTGIGMQATRNYVREYCQKRKWELVEINAKEDAGQDYEEIVMNHGFPGPGVHRTRMYPRLKERSFRVLHRRFKEKHGGKIMIVTGIRHDESDARSGYGNQIIQVNSGIVWVNAFYWFNKQKKYDYIQKRNLEVNPVNKILGMSGECLCGAYAHKGELDLIRIIEPETADYIEELQERVMKKWPWGWEEEPPKWFQQLKNGQEDVFGGHEEYVHAFQPACVGCGKKNG